MTFVNDDNEVLEVEGKVAMTKQAVSLFGFKVKGDYSVNFRVDNNSETREKLNYQGPQMLNQTAWTRQPWSMMRDGNIFMRGAIVIQSDYGDYLDCYFVSGNSNWISLLSALITTLDLSAYITQLNKATIASKTSATSGIIFPMADWAYAYQKNGSDFYQYPITDQTGSTSFFDFYPCLYLHTLVTEIFQQNGLKISGSVLDDPLYKSFIVTPTNGQMQRPPFKDMTANGSLQVYAFSASYQKYTSFTETSDPDNLFSNNTYTANKTASMYVTLTITSFFSTDVVTIDIYKNGVSVYSAPFPAVVAPYIFTSSLLTYVYGDTFEVYVKSASGAFQLTLNLLIETPVVIGPGDFIDPKYFLPSLACLEVVKFVINYFGCEAYFNQYSKTVRVDIIDKIKLEDAEDWSEYYQSHRNEYSVVQAENNYIRFKENGADESIVNYNASHLTDYGDGNITTGNRIKVENELAKYPFSPSSFGQSLNSMFLTSVPLITLADSGKPQAYTFTIDPGFPANSTQFSWGAASDIIPSGEVIRITNSNGASLGFFISSGGTTTSVVVPLPFTQTDTGYIYRQAITFNDVGARFLAVRPSSLITDFSDKSSISIKDSSGTTTGITTIPYATFSKKTVNYNIDLWQANCAIDNPDSGGFTDPTIVQLYFGKISNILNNPNVRSQLILPEAVFHSFDFSQFVYLKVERLEGYFMVESIANYQESDQETEVNLYMLNG